jgi:Domain of unknown function (DUF4190)/Septum formation
MYPWCQWHDAGVSTSGPYGPPPSGPPGWPPYGYSQQPSPGGYVVSTRKPTDGVSVASLIAGLLVLWPVALVLSVIGFRRTRPDSRQRGRGFAVAGLVLSILGFLLTITVVAVVLAVASSPTGRDAFGVIRGERTLTGSLSRGDCYKSTGSDETYGILSSVASQDCKGTHGTEVIEESEAPDEDAYPGEQALVALGRSQCASIFRGILATHSNERHLSLEFLVPGSSAWNSDERRIICGVVDTRGSRHGSLLSQSGVTSGLGT